MLTTDQQYILRLLQASLKTEKVEEVPPINNREIDKIITRNGIRQTVYQILPSDLQEELYNQYYVAVKQSVAQEYEGEHVLKALSDAGFSCIALKGWELRKMYPDRLMRQMADLDILVRPYQYKRIRSIMEQMGYRSENETTWKHDSFIKGEVHVEMHKRLTDDSGEIQKWELEMWSRAVSVEGNIAKMTLEDYYIFHFVHLLKDFMNGALGLRRIADTWLLSKQPVNMKIVTIKLKQFGIGTFHERMIHLSRATMGDEPMDEDSEVLLKHAFHYGIYGSGKSYKTGRIAAMGKNVKTGKLKSGIAALFLPYKRMKAQNPILEKWPVLLPFCWLKRITQFLKGDLKRYRRMLDYSDISEADYQEMKEFFKAGGI